MTEDTLILRALRHSTQPLSISELSAESGLHPAVLQRQIEGLITAGFEIELQPHRGYRLISSPDRLIADDFMARLAPSSPLNSHLETPVPLAREILVLAETSSTNDAAAQLARNGAGEGLVIFAEKQTKGRGRLGRVWDSAAHLGLWFSLVIRPKLHPTQWTRLTTWAAVSIAKGLEEALPGCRAAIKWPNDIYLQGRKVVGILIESSAQTSGETGFAIVGIGVNVNHLEGDFPDSLLPKAGSLRMIAGPDTPPLDRTHVATLLLKSLNAHYPLLISEFPELIAEAERRSLLMHQTVTIQTGVEKLTGTVVGLNPNGELLLQTDDTQTTVVSGGEVTVESFSHMPSFHKI